MLAAVACEVGEIPADKSPLAALCQEQACRTFPSQAPFLPNIENCHLFESILTSKSMFSKYRSATEVDEKNSYLEKERTH